MAQNDHENDAIKPEGDANLIDTDYQIGQDNMAFQIGPFSLDIHNRVFLISGVAVILFVAITLLFKAEAEPFFTNTRNWLTSNLDWFFMIATNFFVLLAIGLIISPLGRVRIGGTEASPDFSYLSWFAMLFAAGGKVNAPTPQRVFWCTFEGIVAIVLMLGGGLVGLQAMAVSTGFPFAIVLLVSCVALVKGLMEEPRPKAARK